MAKKSTNSTRAKAAASKRTAAPVVEDDELEDLDDLEDLDEFEDEGEDDFEDEEDADEDEPVKKVTSKRAANDAKAAKTKAARTPSKTVTKTPGAQKASAAKNRPTNGTKPKGNAANLVGKRVAEGMVGAAAIAKEVGIDPRAVRVIFRKQDVTKSANGLYEWKPGSRDYLAVVKKVKAAIK